MLPTRNPNRARSIVRASVAAAALLILGAGIARGLRESARFAMAGGQAASARAAGSTEAGPVATPASLAASASAPGAEAP